MGEQRVTRLTDKMQMNAFVKSLLKDVEALEYMLENDWFESDITRIGAEQEMVLVNKKNYRADNRAMEALELLKEFPWVETEIAKFNLEINLDPRKLTGDCFKAMEDENLYKLATIQKALDTMDSQLVLTGILPTLKKHDMLIHNLTPKVRYRALIDSFDSQLIGSNYELKLFGIDDLSVKHNTPLMEACNTSFQVHLQVAPNDFVKKYNISQAVTGPVMAIAANSPLVFGRRLWHESRIALFQQATDTRSTHDHMRERSPRVNFGMDWIKDSILDIYKEDIARFRVLISSDVKEDSMDMIRNGEVPNLRSLQVHNSTIYRWNRPCYGISDNGKPHMRIENRVIPSGPTVADEIANACLWLGLVEGLAAEVDDITTLLSFADVKDNFGKAAKFGIDTAFNWFDSKKITACDLMLDYLIPIARKGLKIHKVDQADIDHYLGIIQARAEKHTNGARWQLRSFTDIKNKVTVDEALTILTASMIKKQKNNEPVHLWTEAAIEDFKGYDPSNNKVEDFMMTDLFTVQKDDIIDLVASLMDWKNLKNVPVEDKAGNLVGLVTYKQIMRSLIKSKEDGETVIVNDIMIDRPITIAPDQSVATAIEIMNNEKIGCLPVVEAGELIGIVMEESIINITSQLIRKED